MPQPNQKRNGRFLAAAMAVLTMLVSAGVVSGPKLREAMQEYPTTFENAELPDAPAPPAGRKPVHVTVEQCGLKWAGEIQPVQ